MVKVTISGEFDGLRFDKFLQRHLPSAGTGFLHKMLRKKNIVLNGKKATGSERLAANDEVSIFFSDETYAKMRQDARAKEQGDYLALSQIRDYPDVLYENEDYMVLNKPAGTLSQKAVRTDVSLNEQMLAYLIYTGFLTEEKMALFRPSVMNRLDRNTSGIVVAAKTYAGARFLSESLASRSIHKEYKALVYGEGPAVGKLQAYLLKEVESNVATISQKPLPGAKKVAMHITDVVNAKGYSLLTIELLTGRSHQIRAWLSHLGHPIVGDRKYAAKKIPPQTSESCGTHKTDIPPLRAGRQLLHARRLVMPDGREFVAEYPDDFAGVLAKWRP